MTRRISLTRALLVGVLLGLIAGLVFVNHDVLRLSTAWPVILGFALWRWLGFRGSPGIVVGAAVVAGALLGWLAFAVPTEYMPVTPKPTKSRQITK